MNKNNNSKLQTKSLSQVKLICRKHNSEIGGVCEDMECQEPTQLICIKCTTEESSCIRQKRHNLLSFDEFINKFFEKHVPSFKSNYTYSKGLNNIEKYIGNEREVLISFRDKFGDLSDIINSSFENLNKKINAITEQLNKKIMQIAEEEQTSFINNMEALKEMMNSDLLHNFNIDKCKESMSTMPLDSFNDSICRIKRTYRNVKNKEYTKTEERLNAYMAVSLDKINNISKQIKTIENSLISKSEELLNEVSVLFSDNYLSKSNIDSNTNINNNSKKTTGFNFENNNINKVADSIKNDDCEFSLQKMDILKEFPIDYSVNSNFLNKTFAVFQHSNGESIICYPTSLFTLKLESLDMIMKEPESGKKEVKLSKDVFNQDRKNFNQIESLPINSLTAFPKVTDRDKYLRLKLTGHGANIVDIKYYQVGVSNSKKNNDYEKKLLDGKKDVENRTLNSNLMSNVMQSNDSKNKQKQEDETRFVTDYLITASEDRSVKIWDISDLESLSNNQGGKINLNNQYSYTSPLLKTLMHQTTITGIQVFFNPLKNLEENLELVSLSYGDKIRVYDLRSYHMRKDVTLLTNANYDSAFTVFNLDNNYNYLITANHLNQVRVWDYELSKVLSTISYPDAKVVKVMCIPNPEGYNSENIIIVDDKGNNSTLNVKTFILSKLNCKYKSNRTTAILLDSNNVLFGCRDGTLHKFSFETLKVEETLDIYKGVSQGISNGVTFIVDFKHHSYNRLIFVHFQTQKLYIFGRNTPNSS